MTYRQIHTQIWKDEWFLDLEPDEKLFFIYLFSNEYTNLAGLYRLNLKVAAFETGLQLKRIKEIITKFAADNKVFFEDGVLWVVNWIAYNTSPNSDLVHKGIQKALASIPECNLKAAYMAHGIPYAYPIHTPQIAPPLTVTVTESLTETVTEEQKQQQPQNGASAVVGGVFQLYESEIGRLSQFVSQRIGDWISDYSEDWVMDAIKVASLNNVRKMAYIEGVLKRWKSDGKDSKKLDRENDYKKYAQYATPIEGEA